MQKKSFWLPFCLWEQGGRFTKIMKVMRITALLFTISLLHVRASSSAQTITLSGKGLTLRQIFRSVEEQTGYVALYDKSTFGQQHTFSITASRMSLTDFLDVLVKGKPVSYDIQGRTIFFVRKAPAVEKEGRLLYASHIPGHDTLSGRIVDTAGKALPEASIIVKKQGGGTKSDGDGRFIIQVAEGDVLVVSSIGYETTEIVVNRPVLDKPELTILLKPSIMKLQDVVVTVNTGYQILPKERVTGSFSSISNKDLSEQLGPNILERLDGMTNALLFDRAAMNNTSNRAQAALTIRGIATIEGNKRPLIIVDNFPYEGDINNINPNEIESVTLLKDAAAASIWGTRAGNGVIVIATKKGQYNQRLRVGFNTNFTVVGKPDIYYTQPMTASDYIDVEQMLFAQGFYDSKIADTRNYPVLSPVVELLSKAKKGQISVDDANNEINKLRAYDVRRDFDKYVYRNGISQQYAVNMQGGTSKTGYFLSAGHDRNIDVLSAVYDRFNLRSNNTFKLSDRLTASTGISYSNSTSRNGKKGYGAVFTNSSGLEPYTRLADNQGNALPVVKHYNEQYIDTAGGGRLMDFHYYPLLDEQYLTATTNIQNVQAQAGLQYRLFRELQLDLKYQYERQHQEVKRVQGMNSYDTRMYINQFTQLDRNTGAVKYPVPLGAVYDRSTQVVQAHNIRGQLNYGISKGDHELNAVAGAEVREVLTHSASGRVYGYDEELGTSAKVDLVNPYRHFLLGTNIFIADNTAFGEQLFRFLSWYGNAAYTWRNRYTFSASVRKDQSNVFGVNSNEKGVPLWSMGISWLVSAEPFYAAGWLSMLKVRATAGYNGNVDLSRSAVTTLRHIGSAQVSNFPYAVVSQFGNPDLSWEKVFMANAGIDFEAFNKRLSGTIEFYVKNGIDLFGPWLMDITAGVGATIKRNVANMKGRGLDVELHSSNITGRQAYWKSDLLLSYNTSKVTRYSASAYGVSDGTSMYLKEGKQLFPVISYRWAGLNSEGAPQGYDSEGKPTTDYNALTGLRDTPDEFAYSGSAVPELFGSLRNRLGWKNLELSFAISYKLNYSFRRLTTDYNQLFSVGRNHADFSERWMQPEDERRTNVPAMTYPVNSTAMSFYTASEATVEKGGIARLQFVNLSWTWRARDESPFSDLKVFVNASNLGVLWRANKRGLDPDVIGWYAMPAGRNFSVGVNANF